MRNWMAGRCVVLAAVVLGVGGRASAELVTFNFSGTITVVNDVNGNFGGGVRVGDAFTGTLVYDTATIDGLSDPGMGRYLYANRLTNTPFVAPLGLTVHVGSLTFQPSYATSAFTVWTADNQPTSIPGVNGDGIEADQPTSLDGATTIPGLTILSLLDRSQKALSSDALPLGLKGPEFTDGLFRVTVFGPGSTEVVALEGSLNLGDAAVPEPASIVLLGCGGLGVLACQRRRRRSAA
ncbi:PEP-CTERM sorting domain-containing protein [Paludisphaera rhizosphaerae]|uniref:PEP-CTERM sorting domain-containing protein n=1 Tax=Paludisphaera rhizosphaerae TaxID=2711216 RepID=UPI0013EA1067|nr:PEP-CTERM sorting domain-containing protein [Paludisphaera rhizosphaerae]